MANDEYYQKLHEFMAKKGHSSYDKNDPIMAIPTMIEFFTLDLHEKSEELIHDLSGKLIAISNTETKLTQQKCLELAYQILDGHKKAFNGELNVFKNELQKYVEDANKQFSKQFTKDLQKGINEAKKIGIYNIIASCALAGSAMLILVAMLIFKEKIL